MLNLRKYYNIKEGGGGRTAAMVVKIRDSNVILVGFNYGSKSVYEQTQPFPTYSVSIHKLGTFYFKVEQKNYIILDKTISLKGLIVCY